MGTQRRARSVTATMTSRARRAGAPAKLATAKRPLRTLGRAPGRLISTICRSGKSLISRPGARLAGRAVNDFSDAPPPLQEQASCLLSMLARANARRVAADMPGLAQL